MSGFTLLSENLDTVAKVADYLADAVNHKGRVIKPDTKLLMYENVIRNAGRALDKIEEKTDSIKDHRDSVQENPISTEKVLKVLKGESAIIEEKPDMSKRKRRGRRPDESNTKD